MDAIKFSLWLKLFGIATMGFGTHICASPLGISFIETNTMRSKKEVLRFRLKLFETDISSNHNFTDITFHSDKKVLLSKYVHQ